MKKIIYLLMIVLVSCGVKQQLPSGADHFAYIDKLFVYDTFMSYHDYPDTIRNIEIDSLEVSALKEVLKRATVMKLPIYKPGSLSLYGQIENKEERINVRFSHYVIAIGGSGMRHYSIKNEQDKVWIQNFICRTQERLQKKDSFH